MHAKKRIYYTCFQFGLLSHVSNDIVKCLRCNRPPPLSPYQLIQKLLNDLPAQQRQCILKDSTLFQIQYIHILNLISHISFYTNKKMGGGDEWKCALSFSRHLVKVKESHNRLGVAQRFRFPDFMTFSMWRWRGCQPHAPATFTPRNVPGTHFH